MTYFNYDFLNSNIMTFVNFLLDNIYILFTGISILSLFIFYMNRRNIRNTSNNTLQSDNLLTSGSFNGNNGNDNARESSRTDLRDRINYFFGYSGGTAAFIALGQSFNMLPSWFTFNSALSIVTVMGVVGYHINSDRYAELIDVNRERANSPPIEDNFNPNGQSLLRSPDILSNNDTSHNSNDTSHVSSPNEDLFNIISKIKEFVMNEDNSLTDFIMNLIAYDEDPTMLYLVCLCVILCNIFINLILLLFTLLVKTLNLEEKEFVKNKPLLYKIVIKYNKIKNIKIIFIVLMTMVMVGFCFLIAYFMWDSFWYYK